MTCTKGLEVNVSGALEGALEKDADVLGLITHQHQAKTGIKKMLLSSWLVSGYKGNVGRKSGELG